MALALFVGVSAALSMSCIAGARRSASVVDRFFAAAPHYDAVMSAPAVQRHGVLSLPGVERADPSGNAPVNVSDDSPSARETNATALLTDFRAPVDPTVRVLRGAMPEGGDPSQVIVNERLANDLHLSIGDPLTVRMFSPDQGDDVTHGLSDFPVGPTYGLILAAVVRYPDDIAHDELHTTVSRLLGERIGVSYDFWEQHRAQFLNFGQTYSLVLRDGAAGREALNSALPSLVATGEQPPVLVADERFGRRASFTTPVDLETTSLLALGIGIAIAATAVLVLLLRTEQRRHYSDASGLHSLGFTRAQLAMVAGLRALPAVLIGGAVGLVGSVALSDRFPIGIGRQLELDRGRQLNVAVVALGTLVTVVVASMASVTTSGASHLPNHATEPRFTVGRLLGRVDAPTSARLGAHLAFQSRDGRRSVTTAQGIAGGAVALVVMGAIGMWLAGANRLYEVPARHGWPWSVAIGDTNFALPAGTLNRLGADPTLAVRTEAAFGQAALNGVSSEVFAIDATGTAPPVIVEGRLPAGSHEIALGTRKLHQLGLDIGDTVTMSLAGGEFEPVGVDIASEVAMTVVGTALAPMFGESDIGDVSVVTLDAIRGAGGDANPHLVMARFGATDGSSALAQLETTFSEDVIEDVVPARIVNMRRVRGVPRAGIALAAVLGTIALAHVIVAGARTHQRQLAVLRALGLAAGGARRVVMWQGALTALATLLIGVPLALLAGATLWRRVAADIGVQPGTVIPGALLLVVPASFAAAVVASLFACRRLKREPVARFLREE